MTEQDQDDLPDQRVKNIVSSVIYYGFFAGIVVGLLWSAR